MEVTLIEPSIHISMKETAHCTCLNISHHVHLDQWLLEIAILYRLMNNDMLVFYFYRNRINQNTTPATHDDMMDLDGPIDNTFERSFPEAFHDPFALMDPNFQQQFFDRIGSIDTFRGPLVSQPREAREVPIEVKDGEPQSGPSDQAPIIEDIAGHGTSQGPDVREIIIIDDGLSSAASAHQANIVNDMTQPNPTVPTAPPLVHVNDYDDDIEEEMIRAAIEASKKDAEELANVRSLLFSNMLL
jgi:hypothetical protein